MVTRHATDPHIAGTGTSDGSNVEIILFAPLVGLALLGLGVAMIIYRDAFARRQYEFRVRNPETVEPSELNLAGTVINGVVAILFGVVFLVLPFVVLDG